MASQKGQVVSSSKTGEVSINLDKLATALQAAIADALHRLAQETRGAAKTVAVAAGKIQIYEDDPFLEAVAGSSPVPADPSRTDVPTNTQTLLQTQIIGQQPDPEVYDPFTPEFRYWNANSALARAINFWGPVLPSGETVLDGSYAPFSRPLFIYVNSRSLARPEVRAFVRYFLGESSRVAQAVGYIPLPPDLHRMSQDRLSRNIEGSMRPLGQQPGTLRTMLVRQ